MYGILDRYIGKNILYSVILISFGLTIFTAIITIIDKMRYIGRGDVDFLFVCEYVGYYLPGIFVTFSPVAILIGGVIGLGFMARNSEITVMQSIGLSRLNIALSSLKSIIPLIIVVMLVSEYGVAPLERHAETRLSYLSNSGSVAVTKSGVWLKEGNSIIGVAHTLTDGSLSKIIRYELDGNSLLKEIHAESGNYENGAWIMHNVTTKEFTKEKIKTYHDDTQIWHLNLNSERVEVIGNINQNQTIKGLMDYISYLEDNHQDASRFRLELYQKLIAPFSMIVMLLLALSTVFGPLRSINMGTRILAGIALGFGYYVLNQIVAPFSLVYGIYPIIGASFATIIFSILAIYLLRRN
ncbi:MAG: LPS export ABC transporter permease LptG [Succinatimonas sp.]|nr:LPS export ABC transporter permease LptG [Succinatimonas sp.]